MSDRPRVVIIDDYGPVRSALARLFWSEGWYSAVVASSADAHAYIGSSIEDPPDVILVDARMGDGNGADIIRAVRHNRRRVRRTGLPIRVVAYTALKRDDPLVADMVAAGADAVAFKDGDFARLEAIVRGDDPGDVEIKPRA